MADVSNERPQPGGVLARAAGLLARSTMADVSNERPQPGGVLARAVSQLCDVCNVRPTPGGISAGTDGLLGLQASTFRLRVLAVVTQRAFFGANIDGHLAVSATIRRATVTAAAVARRDKQPRIPTDPVGAAVAIALAARNRCREATQTDGGGS